MAPDWMPRKMSIDLLTNSNCCAASRASNQSRAIKLGRAPTLSRIHLQLFFSFPFFFLFLSFSISISFPFPCFDYFYYISVGLNWFFSVWRVCDVLVASFWRLSDVFRTFPGAASGPGLPQWFSHPPPRALISSTLAIDCRNRPLATTIGRVAGREGGMEEWRAPGGRMDETRKQFQLSGASKISKRRLVWFSREHFASACYWNDARVSVSYRRGGLTDATI